MACIWKFNHAALFRREDRKKEANVSKHKIVPKIFVLLFSVNMMRCLCNVDSTAPFALLPALAHGSAEWLNKQGYKRRAAARLSGLLILYRQDGPILVGSPHVRLLRRGQ